MTGIRVSEIFGPTIQGEGPLIGRPTVFVRMGGCDFRCAWCDTPYAVLPEYRDQWIATSAEEIFARVEELAGATPLLVSLSGGNPALQPLGPLIDLGRARGYAFALETQGSVAQPWFGGLEWLVLSPKPPSSAMPTDWRAVDDCVAAGAARTALKIVVFDAADYAYARTAAEKYPALPVYLQVGNPRPPISIEGLPGAEADIDDLMARFRWLAAKVAADRWFAATVLPQLHVLAWGNKRGV
jgi:7-carboxy-7-deazaguanine synthase